MDTNVSTNIGELLGVSKSTREEVRKRITQRRIPLTKQQVHMFDFIEKLDAEGINETEEQKDNQEEDNYDATEGTDEMPEIPQGDVI